MRKSWKLRSDLSKEFDFIYCEDVINDISSFHGLNGLEFTAIAMSKYDTDFEEIWVCID